MNVLKDALYNLNPESGTEDLYNQGLIVGVIATIMQLKSLEFEQAVDYLNDNNYLPKSIDYDGIPRSWRNTFMPLTEKRGKS